MQPLQPRLHLLLEGHGAVGTPWPWGSPHGLTRERQDTQCPLGVTSHQCPRWAPLLTPMSRGHAMSPWVPPCPSWVFLINVPWSIYVPLGISEHHQVPLGHLWLPQHPLGTTGQPLSIWAPPATLMSHGLPVSPIAPVYSSAHLSACSHPTAALCLSEQHYVPLYTSDHPNALWLPLANTIFPWMLLTIFCPLEYRWLHQCPMDALMSPWVSQVTSAYPFGHPNVPLGAAGHAKIPLATLQPPMHHCGEPLLAWAPLATSMSPGHPILCPLGHPNILLATQCPQDTPHLILAMEEPLAAIAEPGGRAQLVVRHLPPCGSPRQCHAMTQPCRTVPQPCCILP